MKTTIKEFLTLQRAEWIKAMKGVHFDDHTPFYEWLEENVHSKQEFGIYRDKKNDEWAYTEANKNWEGDDVCSCCGYRYKYEDTETDLCKDCEEIEF